MLNQNLRLFYLLKPAIPRRLQLALRRLQISRRLARHGEVWPIDERTATPPPGWAGWPEGKRFALVLTHDVESQRGYDRCLKLAEFEEKLGFRSVFNFVAEDYPISAELREELERRGFEVGVHGLTHDGSLYHSREEFLEQAARINQVLKDWKATGFRSPCMYHNLEWLHDLNIEYDASTFDTDPFEPQPDALGTIFPVFIPDPRNGSGYVELPYTLPQDLHVFVLMQERSIALWQKKLDWVVQHGGLALVTSHPDYMAFDDDVPGCDEYPFARYREFLEHIRDAYGGVYWNVLPRELARFWRLRFASQKAVWQSSHGYPDTGSDQPQVAAELSSPLPRPAPRRDKAAWGRKPLRVCMVAYTFYDTDGRVKRYAESLVRRGDQVDVIALRRDNQHERDLDNGANVFRIQKRVVNETGKLSYFVRILSFMFRSFWFMAKSHLHKRYDLIHVHNVPDYEVFAALVPKLGGAKIILDIHDILPEFYASKFNGEGNSFTYKALTLIERLSCAFADHVIISNDLWRDKLIARSVAPSKCLTLINYPDLRIFNRVQKHNGKDRFVMIYPGTLNWHQGLDIAVRAFALIKDETPKAEFHIYGEGPSKLALQELVAGLGLEQRVIFHGFVSLGEIASIMSEADLGIVPKRANNFGNEAFSTKILEFLALGVPVVISDTKIDRYYFNDSVVRFFRSEDESALAEAMRSLMRDENERRQLTARGLEFARMYSWDVKQSLYLDLVDGLVDAADGKR